MSTSDKLNGSERQNNNIYEHATDYEGIFRELDVKNSGQLTLDEFRNILKILRYPVDEGSEFIDKMFESIDKNDDKAIDFDDFRSYLIATDDQIMTGFKKIDKNNDGKLNFEEFSNYMNETLNLNAPREKMDIMFKKIAQKDADYISFDEFRNFLLLVPRSGGSRLKTAFMYLVNGLDISSDGDVNMNQLLLNGFGLFLAGGVAGVISRTCTAPFDRIKTFLISRSDLSSLVVRSRAEITKAIENNASPRVIEEAKQNHRAVKDAAKQLANKKIRSPLIQAARTLYLQGGLRAFFVGNGLNTIKIFPESAVKLGVFEATKRSLAAIEGVNDPSELSTISTYLAGGVGGVSGQLTSYPIDTLKFRLQCSNLKSDVRGNELLIRIAKELYHEGGIRIYYRGILAGLGGMFPFAALDLGTFSTIKSFLVKRESQKSGIKEEDVKLPNYVVLLLGAFSGSFGASVVYPVNVLRTRLQAQGTHAHPYTYNGFFDAFRQTIAREGVFGLYKGLVPNLAKVAPAVSISYYVYERLKFIFKLEKSQPM